MTQRHRTRSTPHLPLGAYSLWGYVLVFLPRALFGSFPGCLPRRCRGSRFNQRQLWYHPYTRRRAKRRQGVLSSSIHQHHPRRERERSVRVDVHPRMSREGHDSIVRTLRWVASTDLIPLFRRSSAPPWWTSAATSSSSWRPRRRRSSSTVSQTQDKFYP